MKQWHKRAIESIMEGFDFDKVQEVMTFMDWKWGTWQGTMEIPSIVEIKRSATRLLIRSCNDGIAWSSGGLVVVLNEEEQFLELGFRITREWWKAEYDEMVN